MLLRNSNTGGVEVYDLSNNQITRRSLHGHRRPELAVLGVGNFSSLGESVHATSFIAIQSSRPRLQL